MKEHPFTEQIIARFFEDGLPETQRTAVLNWLSSLSEEEQMEFMEIHLAALEGSVKINEPGMAQETSLKPAFSLIEDRILIKERSRKKAVVQVLAIAASVIPLLFIWFFSGQSPQPSHHYTAKNSSPVDKIIRVNNPLNTSRIIQLPDSSKVSLYPGATLDYAIAFNGKKREVKLSGKAFFKVKHDQLRPFTVQTGEITTVVLGTSFWVDASAETKLISVKVKTGKVGVLHGNQPAVFLLPSEKAIFNRLSGVLAKVEKPVYKKIQQPVIQDMPAALVFNRTPLKQVSAALAENFKISITLQESLDTALPVSLSTKGKTIAEVLQEIKLQIPIDYEIKDNHINIKKQE